MFDSAVILISEHFEGDRYGNQLPEKKEREVLAIRRSVTRTEFYQASQSDYRPNIVFLVNAVEYQNERSLKYDNQLHNIIRSFNIIEYGLDMVELTCERRISHVKSENIN